MEYVVLETGGKQYKVKVGDTFEVDNLGLKEGKMEFGRILMHVSDGEVKVGKPYLSGMVVGATVVTNFKGKKIRVSRFTAKSRHRRVIGFRPSLSEVKIDKISKSAVAKEKPSAKG